MEKEHQKIVIGFLIGCWIGFLGNKIYATTEKIDKVAHFEVIVSTTKEASNVKARLDSLSNLKLESAIAMVEKKNDGRFEVLTWSAVLVLSLLGAFTVFSFVESKSKIRQIVDDELENKSAKIQKEFNDLLSDIKSKSDLFEKNIQENTDKFEELINDAEKSHEKTLDYLTSLTKDISQ
jgi:hypothetical protein